MPENAANNEMTTTAPLETETQTVETQSTDELMEEITRLQADLARANKAAEKANAAKDSATKEADEYKRKLRDTKGAETSELEETREKLEVALKALEEAKKEKAIAEAGKRLTGFTGNENTATAIAGYLYGAEDLDAAIDAISQAWAAREKALRAEFGRISNPVPGSVEGEKQDKGIEMARKLAAGNRSGRSFEEILNNYKR